MEHKAEYRFEPRGVVCTRGTVKTGFTYDAELAVGDAHYYIGGGFKSRAMAQKAADACARTCETAIKVAIDAFVRVLPKAKP